VFTHTHITTNGTSYSHTGSQGSSPSSNHHQVILYMASRPPALKGTASHLIHEIMSLGQYSPTHIVTNGTSHSHTPYRGVDTSLESSRVCQSSSHFEFVRANQGRLPKIHFPMCDSIRQTHVQHREATSHEEQTCYDPIWIHQTNY
jgi:hypothetical protein